MNIQRDDAEIIKIGLNKTPLKIDVIPRTDTNVLGFFLAENGGAGIAFFFSWLVIAMVVFWVEALV